MKLPIEIADLSKKEKMGNLAEMYNRVIERLCAECGPEELEKIISDREKVEQDVLEAFIKFTRSNKYQAEEEGVVEQRPTDYPLKIHNLEKQIQLLQTPFPQLKKVRREVADQPLPYGADVYIAVPRWQMLAPTYIEATRLYVQNCSRGGISELDSDTMRFIGAESRLQETERSKDMWRKIEQQQIGQDILIVPAQIRVKIAQKSARRALVTLGHYEFGLGLLAGSILSVAKFVKYGIPNVPRWLYCIGDVWSGGRGSKTVPTVSLNTRRQICFQETTLSELNPERAVYITAFLPLELR